MRYFTVVTFTATLDIVIGVYAHVHCVVGAGVKGYGFKNHHINCHGAIMTGQTQHADGTWAVSFTIKSRAIIKLVFAESRYVAVPAIDSTKVRWNSACFFWWDVAVDTGVTIISNINGTVCTECVIILY